VHRDRRQRDAFESHEVNKVHTVTIGSLLTAQPCLRAGHAPNLGAMYARDRQTPQLCNENLSLDERARGWAELQTFVESTIAGLLERENKRSGDFSSSLQVFCRLDISVVELPDQTLQYFVSELERSLTVGLYRLTCPNHYTALLDAAVQVIPSYLDNYPLAAI
jgi:hypothetical protein